VRAYSHSSRSCLHFDALARCGHRSPLNAATGAWMLACKASCRMPDGSKLMILGDTPKAVSRRRFIQGVIAGGAAVSSASYLFRSSAVHGTGGVGERLITLNINGQRRQVDVVKQEALAWTLRYKLGLTGTKLGCDRAECGACTVLLGDVPHYSCSVLTHTVRDQKVLSIEGLANDDGTLHPTQQGIVDNRDFSGLLYGPGSLWRPRVFETNPNPTRLELAHDISGNLCPCQDYDKILTALMRGAENLRKVNRG
jgi:aerobic-type carbon monoxide dehydrogenase small subunit (CoxS/CutS family)